MTEHESTNLPKSVEPDDGDLFGNHPFDETFQERLTALAYEDQKMIRKLINARPGLREFLDKKE